MAETLQKPKFPKFIGHLYSNGMDIKILTEMLQNKGYDYKYHTVRRKLSGESKLNFDDIIIFSEVAGTKESIFFEQ